MTQLLWMVALFKYIKTITREKKSKVCSTLKHRFYTNEKLFQLCCIKNDFAKYFTKSYNVFV